MGTWLTLAGRLFDSVPELAQRHAILLTDGENHNETPEQLTTRSAVSRASSNAIAAGSASTGRLQRCAGSPRPCWAAWTSFPSRTR